MSNSKFEYVKDYEIHSTLLKGTFIVVRIDGKAFTKFCERHNLIKPNDIRCVQLMISAALYVCETFNEIFIAYGQSDEFSFAFKQDTKVYQRREQKISSVLVSTFTSAFLFNWNKFFDIKLQYPVTFDSRIILYPDLKTLQDYFYWRQVDCHINNLYNTTFWMLREKKGLSNDEAHTELKGTFSKDKHDKMFSMGFNYNNCDNVFKKGTIIVRVNNNSSVKNLSNSKKDKNKAKEIKTLDKSTEVHLQNNQDTNINDVTSKLDNFEINSKPKNEETVELNHLTKLAYDEKLNSNLDGTNNSEFPEMAKYFLSQGIKILNEDMINNTQFWDSLLYK